MPANPNRDKAGVPLAPLPTGKLSGTLGTPGTFKRVVAPLGLSQPRAAGRWQQPAAPPSVQFSTQTLSRWIAVSMTTEKDASTLHLTQQ